MNKTEVLVDTCFLQKLSSEGKQVENFKAILEELDYKPVLHPHIAEHELAMFYYVDELIKEGYIRVAEYSEFILDEYYKKFYEDTFRVTHDDLYKILKDTKKEIPKLPDGIDVFTFHRAKMSLGDVHMIIMAFMTGIPVILTQDSDITALRAVLRKTMTSACFSVDILDIEKVLEKVALKEEPLLTKELFIEIINSSGQRKHRSELKTVWNETHGNIQ